MQLHWKFNLFIRILMLFLGIITSIFILYSDKNIPIYLCIIPFVYSILILITPSFTKYMFKYIGLFTLNLSMFIRYMLSPLLISFYGFEKSANTIPSIESMNLGINIMLYELLIVFIIFKLLNKRFYSREYDLKEDISGTKNITGWLLIGLSFVLVLIYPEILSRYAFIFNVEELKSKVMQIEVLGIIPLIVQLGILTITISLINIIYKRYNKNQRISYVIIVILIIVLSTSFIIGTSRFSVVLPLVTGFYITFILFKKHWRFISIISITIILSVVVLSSSLKSHTVNSQNVNQSNSIESFSDSLQLYFSGVNNVAIAVETKRNFGNYDYNSIATDITRGIVFINSFFTSSKSSLTDFNITYYNGGAARDQILPIIGQGYLYFGFLLSPLLTVIIMILLMFFDSRIIKQKDLFIKYIYAYVGMKFGLFMMSNFTILLSFMTNHFLILLFIFKANNKIINSCKKSVIKEGKYEHY